MEQCAAQLARIGDMFVSLLGEHQVVRAEGVLRFLHRDVWHSLVVFDGGEFATALIAVALPRPVSRERCRGLFEDLHAEWRIGILEEGEASYLAASAPASSVRLIGAGRALETITRALERLHAVPGKVSASGTRRIAPGQGSLATASQLTGRNQRTMK